MYRLTYWLVVVLVAATAQLLMAVDPLVKPFPPKIEHPSDNPTTPAKVSLGKKLFFDTRLSQTEKISCSSCHDPAKAWTDGRQFAIGVHGRVGKRNTPSLFNVAYNEHQFWNGRVLTLEKQALEPIKHPSEMNMNLSKLVVKLEEIEEYRTAFLDAFDGSVTPENIGKAIAAFERMIISKEAAIDRYSRGEKAALSATARRGMNLFFGDARCHLCHSGPNFSDQKFHNIGVGVAARDQGRSLVTSRVKDHGAFKTPTLREVAHTAPYMHDGSIKTLEAVVKHYNFGGVTDAENPTRDELLEVLYLSEKQVSDLVVFLKEGLSSPTK
jgi:cytochrome c peroxidase